MVKKTILLLWLMALVGSLCAQFERDTILVGGSATWFSFDFDNPNPELIEFDPPENNIWQIGKPNKAPFAPYTGDQAIMTDTTLLLDSMMEHSFILKFTRLPQSNAIWEWSISFKHFYQFDSLVSGGYISVSYDDGNHWTNVVNDDYLYDDSTGSIAKLYRIYGKEDTLNNGLPALTGSGKTNGEYLCGIIKEFECTYWDAAIVNHIWVKFTYINLGDANPHAGWMIDDLSFYIETWCEFLGEPNIKTENTTIKVYPNPATNTLHFDCPMIDIKPLTLDIYDMQGKKVLTRYGLCCTNEYIDVGILNNGFYVYQLYNQQHQYRGNFIVHK